MKTLITWLTRNQRCDCGGFKLSRAATCFDCEGPTADVVQLADRKQGRRAA